MKPITTVLVFCFLALNAVVSSAREPLTLPQRHASQVRYSVKDLGTLPGGHFSQATFLTNNRLMTGISASVSKSWRN